MNPVCVIILRDMLRTSFCNLTLSFCWSEINLCRHANRRTAAAVSYKEDSDEEKTGSEDLVEVEWNETETPAEPDNAETIEKILAYRRGKKGGNENIIP